MRFVCILFAVLFLVRPALAACRLNAVFPYSMEHRKIEQVQGLGTVPLYLDLVCTDDSEEQTAALSVTVPEGFELLPKEGWRIAPDRRRGRCIWHMAAGYGRAFDLLYVRALEGTAAGNKEIQVHLSLTGTGPAGTSRTVPFRYLPDGGKEESGETSAAGGASSLAERRTAAPGTGTREGDRFHWYIQSVTLPVDNQGNRDDRSPEGVLYVRDTLWENFRNRMTGERNNGYGVIFSHPAAYFLLDMRNPQQDVRLLRVRARLFDKDGRPVPGLVTAGRSDHESGEGWAGETGTGEGTAALISLDGRKMQAFVLPLYVDPLQALEGEYRLRLTVEGNGQQKGMEIPVILDKEHSLGLLSVGVSFACLLLAILYLRDMMGCIRTIGARGAITAALFAAVSFGGVTVPATLLGDVVHALLGPFSTFFTGLLSGVMQYLLLLALLMLYRKPGVTALLFLLKFFLNGIFFGRFTPLGILSTAVYIAVLETVLRCSGFYRTERMDRGHMLAVVILLGMGDALIGFVNLEQMMFFYRLYYADWYIILYMLVNGVLYSSIGGWLGYRTGEKLQQIAGE